MIDIARIKVQFKVQFKVVKVRFNVKVDVNVNVKVKVKSALPSIMAIALVIPCSPTFFRRVHTIGVHNLSMRKGDLWVTVAEGTFVGHGGGGHMCGSWWRRAHVWVRVRGRPYHFNPRFRIAYMWTEMVQIAYMWTEMLISKRQVDPDLYLTLAQQP